MNEKVRIAKLFDYDQREDTYIFKYDIYIYTYIFYLGRGFVLPSMKYDLRTVHVEYTYSIPFVLFNLIML